MAYKREDGRFTKIVYFADERVIRKIERAAKLRHQSFSAFVGQCAERIAAEVLEERKALAAERQLSA